MSLNFALIESSISNSLHVALASIPLLRNICTRLDSAHRTRNRGCQFLFHNIVSIPTMSHVLHIVGHIFWSIIVLTFVSSPSPSIELAALRCLGISCPLAAVPVWNQLTRSWVEPVAVLQSERRRRRASHTCFRQTPPTLADVFVFAILSQPCSHPPSSSPSAAQRAGPPVYAAS